MPTRYEKPWWDDRTKQMASIMRDVEKERREADIFSTPKSIYKYFDKRLFGCHEYKKALSTAIWSSINLKTKTNFLVIGPSGCGKTELARILSNVYYNTTIFDASTVAPVSYKGTVTMSQCLLEVDTSDHAKPAWIFIDEIDKALLKESELAPMIMNELLKMIEGGNIYAGTDEKNKKLVDTSKINFVMLGTFSELKNERRKTFGFISEPDTQDSGSIITRDTLHNSSQLSNEFLGRINGGIIEVEPMDEKKAEALLADENYSPIKKLERKYRVEIELSEERRRQLVGMVSKYGVRGIYTELQTLINDAIFEDCYTEKITL